MDLGHTSIVFGNIVDRAYFGLVSANSDSKFDFVMAIFRRALQTGTGYGVPTPETYLGP